MRQTRGVRQRCGFWVTALLCAAVLGSATPAHAQNPDDMARQHFESGVAYLQESDYESALRAFQKAYDLSKRPEILLNIANVQERQGKLSEAVSSLEGYLAQAPGGEHAAAVQLRITNLKKRLETEPAPNPAAGPAPAQPVAAQPVTPEAPKPAPMAPSPAPRPAAPNRVPAFVALGIGGAAAAASLVTGLLAQGEYDEAKSQCGDVGCTDDQLSAGRTLAVTSTVLTGVAVVGAAVGVTLWFTAEHSERQASVSLSVQSGAPRATAAWRF